MNDIENTLDMLLRGEITKREAAILLSQKKLTYKLITDINGNVVYVPVSSGA